MTTTESGARARTRREIVSAAVVALAQDPGASLADVAAAAQVSRTTVHRYFGERSELLAAVTVAVMDEILAATRRAGLDRGPAQDALARLCREYFELGPALTLLFSGIVEIREEDWACMDEDAGRGLSDTVARGQADGSIGADLTSAWIEHLLWTVLYAAWSFARERDVPRHEALDLCLLSLRKAISP